MTTKPKIEKLNIDIELIHSELKLKSDKYRYPLMRKYGSGPCIRCYALATHKLIYDIGDGILIELYCDTCLNDSKRVSEGRSEKDIDKLN